MQNNSTQIKTRTVRSPSEHDDIARPRLLLHLKCPIPRIQIMYQYDWNMGQLLHFWQAAIRPSCMGSGDGWCRKMRICPECNFGLLHQTAGRHSFSALDKVMQFWELKWPPFGHLGSHLEMVGGVRCVFVQSIILVCMAKWLDSIVFKLWANLYIFGN